MLSPVIVSIIGARPQFIKAAVVSRALAKAGFIEAVVHTGQHYDDAMSGQFLKQLGISVAANLAVGSAIHAHQTARMMTAIQDYLDSRRALPDAILVYGDTNSTLAAGLVASKIAVPLVHVEAGLRSYNRAMPEEVNRVVVDHLSELRFCSSHVGLDNLAMEGIASGVVNVGDVMLDAFLTFSGPARASPPLPSLARISSEPFILATLHRPANTDDPTRFAAVLARLGSLDATVVWPVHPRTRAQLGQHSISDRIICIDPVGYFEMLSLLEQCDAVITDSGGVQKEAHWAKRLCITLRAETEWVETLEGGWNVLADPINDDLSTLLARKPAGTWRMLYGDGNASKRIADELFRFLTARK